MRAIFSYGAAGVLIILAAVWLATGTLVTGGNGVGNGERPLVSVLGSAESVVVDPAQQALIDAAELKEKEAKEAKTRADEAAQAATDAAAAAAGANNVDLQKQRKETAEAAVKAAEEAKKKAEEAQASAEAVLAAAEKAEEEAHHAQEQLDVTKTIAERQSETLGAEATARSVRTETFTLKPLVLEAPLRGRTKAKSLISVVPETAGTVTIVHVQKGDRVAKGDPLCTLDRGTRRAGVDQAQAALLQAQAGLEQAQQQFDTNKELRDAGLAAANSASQFESALKAAEAGVAAAQSAVDNATAEWDRTDVVASAAGVIQDPLATVGSMLGPQAPCATIVELDPMLFVGSVPEARIGLARIGLSAKITTITGQEVEGKVSYISTTADPATRSFPVEIEIPNAEGALRDGLTASAIVNLGTAPAHLLPQSVLTLDDDGVLGVRAVEDGLVAFHPVTIIKDTRDGIWVTGLPAKVDIITVGQEFVTVGQKVVATNVTATPEETASAEGVAS